MVKIAVIGGGIAGYTAAIRASQLGADVTLVEKGNLGGVCLNEGCIPTKKLLYHAKLYLKSKDIGSRFNFKEVTDKTKNAIERMRNGISFLLSQNKVNVIKGEASILSEKEISIKKDSGDEVKINCDYLILAVGSVPLMPKSRIGVREKILSSQDILKVEEIPKNLAVVGAGYMGLEFASLFSILGSKVTVFEKENRILLSLDGEIVKELQNRFSEDGILIKTNQDIKEITQNSIKISDETLNFDMIIACTGRKPQEIKSKIKLKKEKGYISVNDSFQTSVKNIYAIGDCTGKNMFAYTASHQAEIIAEMLVGKKKKVKKDIIPICIFTNPEIAGIGSLESKNSISVKIPFSVNGKANCEDSSDGFLKLIADKNKKIIGAHIINSSASELITPFIIAINKGLTTDELSSYIYPHPIFGEMIEEAANAINDKSINFFKGN